jgi:hypothetical protein
MSDSTITLIKCRANIYPGCLHGKPASEHEPPAGDGTYDPSTDTIVCNNCYAAIMPFSPSGAALTHEIGAAIENYKINFAWCQGHANPEELVIEAERNRDKARPDSAMHRSSQACVDMAKAEIKRREEDDK